MSPAEFRSVVACVVAPAAVLTAWSVALGAGHDYIQFHAAAHLIAAGENPYGIAEQARAQRPFRNGPDPDDLYDRLGVLPYFYPPWLALACLPLSRLAYPLARAVWVFLGALGLAAAGAGLARGRVPPRMASLLALGLMPSYHAVQLGQTTPLIVALLALAVRALDSGADRLAGAALAGLTIKPQLSVVVIPAALLWSARRNRWSVVGWFSGVLATMMLVCTCLIPSWPIEMLQATRRTPLPTVIDPSVGVTWLCVLRTLGLAGRPLSLAYAAAAAPAVSLAFAAAWDRTRPPSDAIGRGLIAAFLVAPYALGYDLAVLLVPLLGLLATLSHRASLWLLIVAVIGPYLTLHAVLAGNARLVALFWMPAGLAMLRLIVPARRSSGILVAPGNVPR